MIDLPPPWEHQKRAIELTRDAVRRQWRAGNKGCGVLLCLPTGAGKTHVGLSLFKRMLSKGKRLLWLAHRTELIDQPIDKMAAYGWTAVRAVKKGRVVGDPNAPITVASIQTLRARDYAPEVDAVIFDEARHYTAPDWGQLARAYLNVPRIGLDATPARSDGTSMRDLFDELVQPVSVRELIDAGILTESVIHAPSEPTKELAGDPVEKWFEHAEGMMTIVFCQTVSHAYKMAEDFCAAGVPAEAVEGNTKDRRAPLQRLRSGEIKVLVNCMLYTEGLDVPELQCAIIARGLGHSSMWIQIGGRIIRAAKGKELAHLIDLRGHMHRPGFGLLDDPRQYSLDGEPMRLEPGLPPCVQCKHCHAWGRGGRVCSACGHELPAPKPPRVRARELQAYRSQTHSAPQKLAALERYVRDAIERGHNPWRAQHIYAGVYGKKPPAALMRSTVANVQRDIAAV